MTEITDNRPQVTEKQIEEGLEMLRKKLYYRLNQKGYGIYVSSHETSGIIHEEMREFEREVEMNDKVRIEEELLDIAVGSIFGIISSRTGRQDWP